MSSRKNSANSGETRSKPPNKETATTTECSPMLNVNIVNEEQSESAAKVSASVTSVASPVNSAAHAKISNIITSNLSLNTSKPLSSTKITGSGLFSSLKATTLNASKIFNKAASMSRSSSPQSTSRAQGAGSSKKPIDLEAHIITSDSSKNSPKTMYLIDSSSECSSSSSEDDDLGSETDDEFTAREESSIVDLKSKRSSIGRKAGSSALSSRQPSSSYKSANKKKSFLSASLFEDDDEEDDDDDDENMDSMHRDLDEDCYNKSTSAAPPKRSRLRERRQSKINSAAVARCSLKTLSNLPSNSNITPAHGFKASLKEKANQTNTHKAKTGALLKKNSTKDGFETTTTTIKTSPAANTHHQSIKTNPDQPAPNMQANPGGKKSPNQNSVVNTSTGPGTYTRQQSVSFSDETGRKDSAQPLSVQNNNESTLHLIQTPSQRIEQLKEENSSDLDLIKPITTQNFSKQDSIRSAPPIGQPTGHLQQPLEMSLLNSSFNSSTNTGIGLESSFNNSPSIVNKGFEPPGVDSKPVDIKILQKSMTKGSKAMRLMGNNSLTIGNGPLKNTSAVSISQKSTSSFGRGNNTKKVSQKRLFFKNGNINISRSNIQKRRRRYLTDIFTTLIDLKWRYNIIVFLLGFFISWTFFAIAWYLISYIHGDLEANIASTPNRTSCISGIHGFAGAILFSIETQQTIGYGVRYTTEKCPEAIFVMMIQSSVGVMIQSFMVGVVFAKLSRPKKRSETLMFSKNAVISLRDGRLCLICRVGDMRKSHIVEAHVRMYLIKKKVTLEGEILPLHMYDLNVGWDKGLDRLFLVWPLTIEHNIDENSPLWTISAEDLRKERFELAVILEGIVESTGMTTQARSSYLVNEILWGHRFEKLITFQKEDGTYKIDYSRFDVTVPIDTPTCSAKEWAEIREQEKYYNQQNEFHSMSNPSLFTAASTAYLGQNSSADLRKRNSFNNKSGLVGDNNDTNDVDQGTQSYASGFKMVVEDHSTLEKQVSTNVENGLTISMDEKEVQHLLHLGEIDV